MPSPAKQPEKHPRVVPAPVPRATELRLHGARAGRHGPRAGARRRERQPVDQEGFVVFSFLKDTYSSSPEGPSGVAGSARGQEARRRATLLNSKCPRPCGRGWGRPGAHPQRGHSGPCARGAALLAGMGEDKPQAQPPAREKLLGKPVIVCGNARSPQPSPWGAWRPPSKMGHGGTWVFGAGEMMAGSKAASSSCTEPSLGHGGLSSPLLSLPAPREGEVAARETLRTGPAPRGLCGQTVRTAAVNSSALGLGVQGEPWGPPAGLRGRL